MRASASESVDLSNAPDYNAMDAYHEPVTGVHTHAVRHAHSGDNNHGTSANVIVDDSTGIPGPETQLSAARKLEMRLRELELEELASRSYA